MPLILLYNLLPQFAREMLNYWNQPAQSPLTEGPKAYLSELKPYFTFAFFFLPFVLWFLVFGSFNTLFTLTDSHNAGLATQTTAQVRIYGFLLMVHKQVCTILFQVVLLVIHFVVSFCRFHGLLYICM